MRGRTATSTIWRTVVFAGAMLGSPACTKSSTTHATTPTNAADEPATPTETADTPPDATEDPCGDPGPGEDPCGEGRARGGDDEEGGVGRGFVLS